MRTLLLGELAAKLRDAGVECLWGPRQTEIELACRLEPPCSLKWMNIEHSLSLGAFSYAVSGFFFAARIGRYTSMGEQVQIGRGNHPTFFMSTSPTFYLHEPLFNVGKGFAGAEV